MAVLFNMAMISTVAMLYHEKCFVNWLNRYCGAMKQSVDVERVAKAGIENGVCFECIGALQEFVRGFALSRPLIRHNLAAFDAGRLPPNHSKPA